jgi:hypothetical protein
MAAANCGSTRDPHRGYRRISIESKGNIVQSKLSSSGALKWLWVTLLVVGLDQITKIAMVGAFALHEQMQLAPYFNLTLAHNPGAAWCG